LVAPTALTLKAAELQNAGLQLAPLCDENSTSRFATKALVNRLLPPG
jgi:hypothetical protein